MRIYLSAMAAMLLAVSGFGQAPKGPAQGPPPKNLSKQSDGHVSANALPANPDKYETHIVVPGDTLSRIAGDVLKDYKLWPQLWEMNEHIVNPHWIYPEDKILIRPITKITEAVPPEAAPAPAAPVVEAVPPPAPPPVPASRGIGVLGKLIAPNQVTTKLQDVFDFKEPPQPPEIKASDIYCSGFVRSAPVSTLLKVSSTYQRSKAELSTEGQYVHINQGSAGGVKSGLTYQVVRPTKHVSSPSRTGSASDVGTHYLDVGQIQVVQVSADSALARVFGNCEPIAAGDLLIPVVRYEVPVLPRNRSFSSNMVSTGGMKGNVVLMKNEVVGSTQKSKGSGTLPNSGSIVAEGEVVYIDLGKADGLKPGDLFIVFRGTAAIGEVAVLKVDDKASSALVTYSTDAMALGDRVEHR